MRPGLCPKHGRICHCDGTWRLVIITVYYLVLSVPLSCAAFRVWGRGQVPASGHLSLRSPQRSRLCNATPTWSVVPDGKARKERRWRFKPLSRLTEPERGSSTCPSRRVLCASPDCQTSTVPPAREGNATENLKPDQYRPSEGEVVLVQIQFIVDTGEGFGSIRHVGNRCKNSSCRQPLNKEDFDSPSTSPPRSGPKSANLAATFASAEPLEEPPTSTGADPVDIRKGLLHLCGEHRWPVFVPFSIPGEYVWVRVHKTLAHHSIGFIVAYVNAPSSHRLTSPCPYFGVCSGCQYQHMPLSMQHEVKRGHVRGVLSRLAGLPESVPVNAVLSNNEGGGYHYRSKITPHYTFHREGSIPSVGYNDVRSPRRVLEIESCKLALRSINEKLVEVRKQVAEQAQTVTPGTTKSRRKGATLLLRDTGLNSVTSDSGTLCVATGIDDLHCWYRAGDFFQVNRRVLPLLVAHVREQLRDLDVSTRPRLRRRLLDCYCGVGLFALACHDEFDEVVGFDVSPSSIELAKHNAQFNSKWRARFEVSDAKTFFESFGARHSSASSRLFVVLDPPRKGCDAEFLQSLLKLKPERIVYISCHPATQARDLKAFLSLYAVKNVQPFDMFPHSRHIECVITLERTASEQAHGWPLPSTKLGKAGNAGGFPGKTGKGPMRT
uniref:Methyltransferase, related n=1 Tax=Neospora caninum (strain Liverpool) TaxID=572307 RepID=A0A0F7UCY2_NEOCL|nr:TPA: Methyltransferase, related [Neospora caninum Liverpool]